MPTAMRIPGRRPRVSASGETGMSYRIRGQDKVPFLARGEAEYGRSQTERFWAFASSCEAFSLTGKKRCRQVA